MVFGEGSGGEERETRKRRKERPKEMKEKRGKWRTRVQKKIYKTPPANHT